MTVDEGYIKYSSDWTPGPPPDAATTELLNRWRRRLYAARLIGFYDDINAVVHVHSTSLWTKLKPRIPTTSKSVAYGTSEMAHEFQRLYRETEFPDFRIAVMAGHEDGLICIGETLEESAQRVLRLVEQPR